MGSVSALRIAYFNVWFPNMDPTLQRDINLLESVQRRFTKQITQALSVLVFTPRSREAENKILAKEDENLSLK